MQIISKAVGIDLGTTNSAVAIMNPTDTDIILHRDAKTRAETTPSCVWKDPKSGQIIVGRKAFSRAGSAPLPIRSIKRSMGKSAKVRMTDVDVSPEQVSASILGEMKRQIEEDVARFATDSTTWIVDRAIITVPAYFDTPNIEATKRAGELAGLQVVDLLHEPSAAACYHCWRTGTRNGVFLVYDFGGGTFDVSVLRSTEGAFEVLGISGNNLLGGDNIDTALAEHLQERLIADDYELNLDAENDPEDKMRFDKLKFIVEGVKKALSNAHEFKLTDTSLQDKSGSSIIIDMIFERSEVDDIMRPIIERTLPYCDEAIDLANKKAGITLADVDAVILAGGSTHIPLVREMVRQKLCSDPEAREPRAKCTEPVYDKVDTLVALGAAIRAAAVGGLAVYNPERTVRVTFRGTGATGARETHIGGTVEPVAAGLDLVGGRVRLSVADTGYTDEEDLKEGGSFGFKRVPLQQGAENLLTFEVYDRTGNQVATAGRPVRQSPEAARPTGGAAKGALLSKAILLDVKRAGQRTQKELAPALTALPAKLKFGFIHPGDTETVVLNLYQQKRKIKEIKVPVSLSLPRGTPIDLNLNIDDFTFITVDGSIGETAFSAAVEIPPDREMPTQEEVLNLERAFKEAVAYLPAGKKAIAEAGYKRTKNSFDAAAKRGDKEQAIHDFEEMEEIVSQISVGPSTLQPPKEAFSETVAECHEINRAVARAAAEAGQPHDHRETEKAIEAQRVEGEKAYADDTQKRLTDAVMMLESIRNNLIALGQKLMGARDTRTDGERASDSVKGAGQAADKVSQLAAASGRKDFEDEVKQIKDDLHRLSNEAQKNPHAVQEKVQGLWARLQQIKNALMGKKEDRGEGDVPEDFEAGEGKSLNPRARM